MPTMNIGVQRYPSLRRRRPLRRQNLSLLSILIFAFFFLGLFPGCLYIPQQRRNVRAFRQND